MKNSFKKIFMMTSVAFCALSFTGCGKSLEGFVQVDLKNQLATRFDENQSALDKLYDSGILSEALYKSMTKTLESNKETFCDKLDKDKSINTLIKSIVAIKILNTNNCSYFVNDNGDTIKNGDSEFTDRAFDKYSASNYLLSKTNLKKRFKASGYTENGFIVDTEFNESNAVPIIDDTQLSEELNNKMNYELYVLKDSIKMDGMDEIIDCIDNAIGKDGKIKKNNNLDKYFKDSGSKLFECEDENSLKIFKTSSKNLDRKNNRPGKDCVISQYGEASIVVRIKELDLDSINELINKIGMNNSKYLFDTRDGVNRVYLMEYPVSVLDTLSYDSGNIKGKLKDSEIGINIKSKKVIKYNTETGSDSRLMTGTVMGEGIDNYKSYYSFGGADDETADKQSSFAINGSQTVSIEKGLDENGEYTGKRDIKTCRIILKDYLEATYAPDYIEESNTDMYVFGRKLRLKIASYKSDGTIALPNEDIAKFVDFSGNNILNSNGDVCYIDAKDLVDLHKENSICDSESRDKKSYAFNRIRSASESNNEVVQKSKIKNGETPKNEQLKIVARDSIKPILKFPSEELDIADVDSKVSGLPLMYAIGTNTDMFSTDLYSSWIATDNKNSGIKWWAEWLNKSKFKYRIDAVSISNYLNDNYTYDMSQEGNIILDLKTVAKVQKEYDILIDKQKTKGFRTFFKVIGWVLVLYSIILVLVWTMDTELAFGIKLYTVLTFGRLIAYKYKEDIADGKEAKRYVGFSQMIIKSLVLLTIGLLLLRANILGILVGIVSKMGTIGKYIMNYLNI